MHDSNGQCHPQRNRSRQTVPKGEMNSLTRAFGVRSSTKRSNKDCNGSLCGVCPKHFVVKGMKVIMCWVNVVLGRLKDLLGYL